jgi:hypothetical protein
VLLLTGRASASKAHMASVICLEQVLYLLSITSMDMTCRHMATRSSVSLHLA